MKIRIVGSGFVGATAGYALVMQGVGREIVLVDKNAARAVAEADDIRHAVPFAHPLNIHDGDYEDLVGCRVVVLCAGVGQKLGETMKAVRFEFVTSTLSTNHCHAAIQENPNNAPKPSCPCRPPKPGIPFSLNLRRCHESPKTVLPLAGGRVNVRPLPPSVSGRQLKPE
jgi:hypothetical protein